MNDLWTKTMSDPAVFWAAFAVGLQLFQSLFVFGSALFIFAQLKQIQEESIEKKIAGLQTALSILDTDLFRQVSKQAMQAKDIQGVNWRKLLEALDLVETLIEERYTNEILLLRIKEPELKAIGEYILQNRLPEDIQRDVQIQYQGAVKLLKKATGKQKSS